MDNYRPVSLLTSISKVFEKVVFTHLYAYFDKHNLFYSSQYGFRKKHSTEMAGLELTNAIFMAPSKAFDTLAHQILLHKLKYHGVNDLPLKWFSSYLTDVVFNLYEWYTTSNRLVWLNIICRWHKFL